MNNSGLSTVSLIVKFISSNTKISNSYNGWNYSNKQFIIDVKNLNLTNS